VTGFGSDIYAALRKTDKLEWERMSIRRPDCSDCGQKYNIIKFCTRVLYQIGRAILAISTIKSCHCLHRAAGTRARAGG
jgi:hypothetical protein